MTSPDAVSLLVRASPGEAPIEPGDPAVLPMSTVVPGVTVPDFLRDLCHVAEALPPSHGRYVQADTHDAFA